MKTFVCFLLGLAVGWALATHYPLTIRLVHLHVIASPSDIKSR